jgi:hypothetical protein
MITDNVHMIPSREASENFIPHASNEFSQKRAVGIDNKGERGPL